MHIHLPTCVFGSWTVTSLRNSIISELNSDKASITLRMFFYAITSRGWTEIRKTVLRWKNSKPKRSVVVYVGTDHGITEPAAMELMQRDQVEVRLMSTYQGVFHPKVVWLSGVNNNIVWVGSNNLTKDGLLHNIEFAILVKSNNIPVELKQWADAVASGSELVSLGLLRSYQTERQEFEKKRAKTNTTTFTWSRKKEPQKTNKSVLISGTLIIEIMPKETGPDGSQIQLPLAISKTFFGLAKIGESKKVFLRPKDSKQSRPLTMKVYPNNTVRLSISDLEYRDRPCVIIFRKINNNRMSFEIVAQNIYPTRYQRLLKMCTRQTRKGSRRWGEVRERNVNETAL